MCTSQLIRSAQHRWSEECESTYRSLSWLHTQCVCDVDVRCSDSLWQTAHIAYDTKKNKLFPISTYVCRRRFIRLFIRGVYGVLYGDGYIAVMFMKYSYLLTIELRI